MKKSYFIISALAGLGSGIALGAVISAGWTEKRLQEQLTEKQERADKFYGYFNIMNQWMTLKERGDSIDRFFVKNHYHTIAIYGMGILGNHFFEEIKENGQDLAVKYAIDKNASKIYAGIDVYTLEDELPQVDVIVVTATFDYEEISDAIKAKVSYPVVSLGEVVFNA